MLQIAIKRTGSGARKLPRSQLLLLACAWILGACGTTAGADAGATAVEDSAVDTGKNDSKDSGADGGSTEDTSLSDVIFNPDIDGDVPIDSGNDAVAEIVVDPNLCNAKNAKSGECGWSCTSANTCNFPFCVPTRDDTVCTVSCSDGPCPIGWKCQELQLAPDQLFGCIPVSPNLGKPCFADSDCLAQIGIQTAGTGNACVKQGDAGAFCGTDCDKDPNVCPSGFTCKKGVSITTGKSVKQCIADKMDDNCTQRFSDEADETVCRVSVGKDSCAGKRHCDGNKLSACDAETPAAEVCNGKDDNCNGQVDEPVAGAKCFVYSNNKALKCPGIPLCVQGVESCVGQAPLAETCDGQDNDCNGQTDEGCDDDLDGYCDATMGFDPAATECKHGGGDCDDAKAAIHPKAPEICDGFDNDCNGFADALDPGLPLSDPQFCDNQLGVCAGAAKAVTLCVGGKWQACGPTDYVKNNPAYAENEICDDKDNNCSGKIDEGCDDDKDGYCDSGINTLGNPLSCPKGGGDCDDKNSKTHPGASELCDDDDQNCNGINDEGCDKDKDGWCDSALTVFGQPTICPGGGGDCNDADASVKPDASEKCNNVDDDCNGATDEAFPDVGLPCAGGKGACAVKGGTKVCSSDMSKVVCSVTPGPPQTEICDNVDNNCDGAIDEGCDDDFDGFCDGAMGVIGKPLSCLAGAGDCDDTNPDTRPGAKEVCDKIDNDCDGKTDGDDGDLLIDDVQFCEVQQGACSGAKKGTNLCLGGIWAKCDYAQYHGYDPFYSASEDCDNVDNNCDGSTDEGCDADGDGWCDKNKKINGAPKVCTLNGVTHSGDCFDNNAANFPGNDEICDNQDNNCNSVNDEGCDKDFDGFCDAKKIVIGKPLVCLSGGNDCNDDPKVDINAINVNPGIAEVCYDALDNNCDGNTDENCPFYFPNVDLKGPDYSADGWFQCEGYKDQINSDDVPNTNWGVHCAKSQWSKVRIACGPPPGDPSAPWYVIRYIDLNQNVFLPVLKGGVGYGMIINDSGFTADQEADIYQNNLLKVVISSGDSSSYSLDHSSAYVIQQYGADESNPSLIINNTGSVWDVANCFGLGLDGLTRGLLVYVHK